MTTWPLVRTRYYTGTGTWYRGIASLGGVPPIPPLALAQGVRAQGVRTSAPGMAASSPKANSHGVGARIGLPIRCFGLVLSSEKARVTTNTPRVAPGSGVAAFTFPVANIALRQYNRVVASWHSSERCQNPVFALVSRRGMVRRGSFAGRKRVAEARASRITTRALRRRRQFSWERHSSPLPVDAD